MLIISQTGCEKKVTEVEAPSGNQAESPKDSESPENSGEKEASSSSEETVASESSESGDEPKTPEEGGASGGSVTDEITVLESPASKEGFYLDTYCRITIYAYGSTENPESIIDQAFEECEKYENELSKTKESSDIYKLNHAGGKPVTCNEHAINCIADGINYGYYTDGRFNITIGTLTDLWDFHAMNPVVPSADAIKEALQHVQEISIHATDDKIVITGDDINLSDPEARLDVGGLAKGYIADRLSEFLIKKGVTGGVIDLGGNLVVIGYKDGTRSDSGAITGTADIRVGIKKPYTTSNEIVGAVPLHNASIVTSGVYERFFESEGKKYHHILDSATGYPVETDIDSVSVIGELGTSEDCDALATVILLQGEEWLKSMLAEEAASLDEVRFVNLSDFGFVIIRSDGSIEQFGNSKYKFNAQ